MITSFDHIPFPHEELGDPTGSRRFRLLDSLAAASIGEPTQRDVMGVGDRLSMAGVREIILIHGTFAGNDIAGVMRLFSGYSLTVTRMLKELSKEWFDQLAGDVGNYTADYADRLSTMINSGRQDAIAVRRFHWSGENHHLGRACAAVVLLDQWFESDWTANDRLLLFAHSHGGNILAMITLVLGCDRESKRAFMDAIGDHLDSLGAGNGSPTLRERLDANLLDEDRIANLPRLDFATFGTPLRYRWHPRYASNLIHFVQHRPLVPDDPAKAALPSSINDLQEAVGGDYVQQFGIGGTDFPAPPWAWKSWQADRRLKQMFEANVRRRDLRQKLPLGRRVSQDGTTLLVDYPSTAPPWNRALLGHGVYTCQPWLPFHLREVANAFYSECMESSAT